MKVSSLINSSSNPLKQIPDKADAESFQAALAQAQASAAPQPSAAQKAAAHAAKVKEERNTALSYLDDYMKKTPAEHMRDAVMKEMGLTEEELQALPPEERAAKETEITRRVMERLMGKQEGDAAANAMEAAVGPGTAPTPQGTPGIPPASPAVLAVLNAQLRGLASI